MAEANVAQKARRVLVEVVSAVEPRVVKQSAVSDSTLFQQFLAKATEELTDPLDYVDIVQELEEKLDVQLPEHAFATWQQLFEKLIVLLNEG